MYTPLPTLAGASAIAFMLSTVSAAAQDWSGAYYGGILGYGTGSYDQGVPAFDEDGPTVDVGGLLYGVHAGINFQSGNLVYGVDAGFSTGPDGSTPSALGEVDGPTWQCVSGDCYVAINYVGTLRGRVGLVTDIRTVIYGAAGLAVADVDGGIGNSIQEGSSTASGVTYAIGAERITSPYSTVFAEVGYYDLGTLAFGTNEGTDPPPATVENYSADGSFIAITAGVNFKF